MKQTIEPAKILVVDTDVEAVFSVASSLLGQGYRVLTARDYSTAFKLAHEDLDLLITSTRLKERSGIELALSAKQLPEQNDLPVMFLSGTQHSDVILKSHEFGDSYHLKKPVNIPVLVELAEHALWMPHLVRSHVEQKAIREPHVEFAKNPMAGLILPSVPSSGFMTTQ